MTSGAKLAGGPASALGSDRLDQLRFGPKAQLAEEVSGLLLLDDGERAIEQAVGERGSLGQVR